MGEPAGRKEARADSPFRTWYEAGLPKTVPNASRSERAAPVQVVAGPCGISITYAEVSKWQMRLIGRADADKLGQPIPRQEAPIGESGEPPYTIILDRRGTEVTPAIELDHTLPVTDAPPPPGPVALVK